MSCIVQFGGHYIDVVYCDDTIFRLECILLMYHISLDLEQQLIEKLLAEGQQFISLTRSATCFRYIINVSMLYSESLCLSNKV